MKERISIYRIDPPDVYGNRVVHWAGDKGSQGNTLAGAAEFPADAVIDELSSVESDVVYTVEEQTP